jgi:hypothetical protein
MKRQHHGDEDDEWQCIVCLNTTEPDSTAAKEVLTLSCGHRMHLSCWLPCVLPVMGEDSAQARFIEDRSGRKCGLCRAELSSESQSALKDRRTLLREARAKVRIRHDPAMQRVRDLLRSLPGGVGAHAIFDGMPDDDELSLPPEREPMPLDHGDLLTALSHPIGVSVTDLARAMRAELQQSGLSPSGGIETLAHRLIEAGQATRGFFQKLLQRELLTHAQPLRREIEKHLELLEKAPKEAAFPGSAPIPVALPRVAPPLGLPRGPVFSAGDVLSAIQPPPAPAAPPPAAPPPEERLRPPAPSPGVREADIATLRSMGFENEERNRAALRAAHGNVEAALAILLAM